MSEKRKQKAREKRKAKRAAKQKTRRVRNQNAAASSSASLDQILGWPLGEAWLGQDWHEQGARVPAVITRSHPSGGIAAAMFDLDLRERGVVRSALLVGLDQDELNRRLAELSDSAPMVQIAPGHVLACVEAARGLSEDLPDDFEHARALFGDLEVDRSIEVLTGAPPEPEKKKGLLGRLFS